MIEQPNQNLSLSDNVLQGVQIGGIAGRDLRLTQIQGGVGSINVFGTVQVPQAPLSATKELSRDEYRWRRTLLSKVQEFWIDGVLKKSLHNQVLIELGLEKRSKAVPKPIKGAEEFPSESRQVLPQGTSASEIFDGIGAGRTLLILGEPGAGKTVTCLKLAESLISRVENDLSQPLPIILNLSSWAKKRKSIDEWLVQELYEIYGASKSLGKIWIDGEQLILLLDGLDEVEAKYRNDCVKALNLFIQKHGRTEIVICSRIKDYEDLSERLRLRSAIYVKSLTPKQISQYLEQAGEQLITLKTVLKQNTEIRDFASSPLILSIMSLAYQNCPLNKFPQEVINQDFRLRLFDAYIRRMFTRRGTTHQYPTEKTKHWLIWLAQLMIQGSQTFFLIEQIQPYWLKKLSQKTIYYLLCPIIIGVTCGLISGLVSGLLLYLLISLFDYSNTTEIEITLISAISAVFMTTIVAILVSAISIHTVQFSQTTSWSWQRAKTILVKGLTFGFLGASLNSLFVVTTKVDYYFSEIIIYFIRGGINGFIVGLSGGLIYGISLSSLNSKIEPQSYPNQGIIKIFLNSIYQLITGALLGFVTCFLFFNILLLFTTGTTEFQSLSVGELTQRTQYSLSQIVFVGEWHGEAPNSDPKFTQLSLSIITSGIGSAAGFIGGGGKACIQHLILRIILFFNGRIPWNFSRFLDYSTERLCLQKVGGGYIFIHRMLLEHFAAMPLEKS